MTATVRPGVFTAVLLVSMAIITGCSDCKEGKVAGVNSSMRFDPYLGTFKGMSYTGTIAVEMPDGERIDAQCSTNLLDSIKGGSTVSVKQRKDGQWEVTKVKE